MRLLANGPHVTLSIDDHSGLVRYVRSNVPYASVADVRALHEQLVAAIPKETSRPLKLLLDSREAPPRNDCEFEGEIMRALEIFLPLFEKYAFLVKSAAGLLQGQRLARERNMGDPAVFSTEKAALRHLGLVP